MVITGVIRPPPEIRAVADRTASYVAKNGRAFEARILASAKGKTPKFAFLQPTSPFHAYYEDRIQFYENGGVDEDDADQQQQDDKKKETKPKTTTESSTGSTSKQQVAAVRKKEKTQKAMVIDPIAKALLGQRAKISQARNAPAAKPKDDQNEDNENGEEGGGAREKGQVQPPPSLELVTIVAPSNLSPSQLETIQLVAQFAALDGKGGRFLHQLTLREWTNPEFSFCQPRHAHFAYFSALVDAYRNLMSVWTSSTTTKATKKSAVKSGTDTNQSSNLVAEKEEVDIQAVLEEAAYRAEYERLMEQEKSQKQHQEEEGEVAAIDWHDFVVVETIDFPLEEVVELSMLPPPPPPPPLSMPSSQEPKVAKAASRGDKDTMEQSNDEDEDEEEEETIRVVPSYTPKVVGPSNPQQARAIDPITGKSISVQDIPEHLRIQLLDPKWAEERKKFQEKQSSSNLVSGDAIVSNISRLAQKSRGTTTAGDLFGKSEQELLSKEKELNKRMEDSSRILRDQASQQQQHQQTLMQQYAANQPSSVMTGPGSSHVTGGGQLNDVEPPPKRMRMGDPLTMKIPPPPPPPSPQVGANDDTSSGTPAPIAPSGDPLADALLRTNQQHNADSSSPQLLSEAEFMATLSKPEVTLQIRIPNDPTQMAWNFYGQILSMTVHAMTKVKQVREDLSRLHLNGMPANKIQFRDPKTGVFLKPDVTLASLNIGPTATLEMRSKTRGGRK